MNRRNFLSSLPLGAIALGAGTAVGAWIAPAAAKSGKVDIEQILNDPDAPVGGNPDGNVTIVAFLDYNCPYCKGTAPDLKRFVSTDGKIRLVYKDWPILAVSSVYGARLALAAKYQGKYETAHDALMGIHGQKTTEEAMRAGGQGRRRRRRPARQGSGGSRQGDRCAHQAKQCSGGSARA